MAQFPHIEWLDLQNNGVLTECAVMKRDGNGNIYFFPVTSLDSVDKQRLRNILTGRNARNFPLWDLMQQVTLGNGVNALEYFHQLVKVLTPNGQIIDATAGRVGAARRHVAKPTESDFAGSETPAAAQEPAPAAAVGEKDTRTPAEKRAATLAAKKAAKDGK